MALVGQPEMMQKAILLCSTDAERISVSEYLSDTHLSRVYENFG
jgi:hypothetical protein